jgi:SH3-like domain-containing protein
MRNMRGRVIKDYDTPYPEPFVIRKGDLLKPSERDSEWEGWIWCTNAEGKSAWVPESFLAIDGESARVLEDYDARELTVRVGDVLELIKEEAEWFWCRDKDGEFGWVPGNYLELIN